jgi:hypothetical protein
MSASPGVGDKGAGTVDAVPGRLQGSVAFITGAEFVIDGGLTAGRVNDLERAWVAKVLGLEAPA